MLGNNRRTGHDPDTRALMQQVMEEVVAIGKARGVKFDSGLFADQMSKVDGYPASMIASMCGDLCRGNRLELSWLSGTVAKLGDELGIPTPANHFVYAALKHYADGRPAEAVIKVGFTGRLIVVTAYLC